MLITPIIANQVNTEQKLIKLGTADFHWLVFSYVTWLDYILLGNIAENKNFPKVSPTSIYEFI